MLISTGGLKSHKESLNRNARKKGFIVIELIIVLLIIAVLAAILFPRVTENISAAKENAEIAETRTAMVTLQALFDLTYGGSTVTEDGVLLNTDDLTYLSYQEPGNAKLTEEGYAAMEDLAGGVFGTIEYIIIRDPLVVESFRYTTPNGSIVDYNNGTYFVLELY